MSNLVLTDQDLTAVGIGSDHGVPLEHLVVIHAAVEGDIDRPRGGVVLHTDALAGVLRVEVVPALSQRRRHGAAGHGQGLPLVGDVPRVHAASCLRRNYNTNTLRRKSECLGISFFKKHWFNVFRQKNVDSPSRGSQISAILLSASCLTVSEIMSPHVRQFLFPETQKSVSRAPHSHPLGGVKADHIQRSGCYFNFIGIRYGYVLGLKQRVWTFTDFTDFY